MNVEEGVDYERGIAETALFFGFEIFCPGVDVHVQGKVISARTRPSCCTLYCAWGNSPRDDMVGGFDNGNDVDFNRGDIEYGNRGHRRQDISRKAFVGRQGKGLWQRSRWFVDFLVFLSLGGIRFRNLLEVKGVQMFGFLRNLVGQITNDFHDSVTWCHVRDTYARKNNYCLHFIHDEKFTKPFVDFVNEYFNDGNNIVICQCSDIKRPKFPLPEGNNVFYVKRYFHKMGLSRLFLRRVLNNAGKLIFHSLFCGSVSPYLYSHRKLLGKSYWMIWGGDLYNAPQGEVVDYVKSHFHGIITDTDGDDLVYARKYGNCEEVCRAGYTFPITKQMIDSVKQIEKSFLRIQINNSCDYSTLEMLDVLSRFKDRRFKIRVIHSYGDMKFQAAIEKKGLEIFGDDFEVISKYMTPFEYAQTMAENDILILNQNRQQGLGNCFAALALGVKVYIRSEITTFRHFTEKGVVVHDTNQIAKITYEEFVKKEALEVEENRKAAEPFFDGRYLYNLWKPILNSVGN